MWLMYVTFHMTICGISPIWKIKCDSFGNTTAYITLRDQILVLQPREQFGYHNSNLMLRWDSHFNVNVNIWRSCHSYFAKMWGVGAQNTMQNVVAIPVMVAVIAKWREMAVSPLPPPPPTTTTKATTLWRTLLRCYYETDFMLNVCLFVLTDIRRGGDVTSRWITCPAKSRRWAGRRCSDAAARRPPLPPTAVSTACGGRLSRLCRTCTWSAPPVIRRVTERRWSRRGPAERWPGDRRLPPLTYCHTRPESHWRSTPGQQRHCPLSAELQTGRRDMQGAKWPVKRNQTWTLPRTNHDPVGAAWLIMWTPSFDSWFSIPWRNWKTDEWLRSTSESQSRPEEATAPWWTPSPAKISSL